MRVILSAYRNQKRSEPSSSVVDQLDDYFEEQENQPSTPSQIDTVVDEESIEDSTGVESQESSPNTSIENPSSSSSLDPAATSSTSTSDQKLPATEEGEEPKARKRKYSHITGESSQAQQQAPSDHNDSKKPAAKMTGGRALDEEREPPPEDENTVFVLENSAEETKEDYMSTCSEDFAAVLKNRGLEIRKQEGDGNCLFRAVSYQVYGDPNMHMDIRNQCLDHMAKDEEHFSQFVEDEEFSSYLKRKRQEGVHGNNPEIQAISELFNRPVEVFTPENGSTPLNIFQSEYKTSDTPIRLSYCDNHYDAVVDPLLPTAGLGLGLPGLQPGLADKMQLDKAVRESDNMADQAELKKALEESDNDQLQRAIKESSLSVDQMYSEKALALSDLEATNFDLEQAVLESSLDAFRKQESGRKKRATDGSRRKTDSNQSSSSTATPAAASYPRNIPPPPPAAAAPPFASVPAAAASVPVAAPPEVKNVASARTTSTDEYPPTVQELVMNGFELPKVVHAYELIGDNFDDLLAFLVSTNPS